MNVQELDRYQNKHLITFKAHKSEESLGTYSAGKKIVMWPINQAEFNPSRRAYNWLYTMGSNGVN